jgi:1-deoxy-D-xylulose-5-phosphate reductoisomerase
MAAGAISVLADQIRRRPQLVRSNRELARDLPIGCDRLAIMHGSEGAIAVATHPEAKLLMSALVGALGLRPTLAAIKAGKDIAFANKEVLVIAGEVVTRAVREHGVRLLPVDSEHNAVFQCIEGRPRETIKRIILTASGGPFRELPADRFDRITIEDALNHPTWRMGHKITIDSATLMNKGLEVIEAHWLFGLPPEKIDVVVHPQSVIHSMVELIDGSVIAEMAVTDMTIPAAFALAYPDRLPLDRLPRFSLFVCATPSSEEPHFARFPCLRLAYEALRAGGTMAACLNAANEELVAGFLAGRIRFVDIPRHIEDVMSRHHNAPARTLEDVIGTDGWARAMARELMGAGSAEAQP